jgi:plasmid segregation protein ParM
MSYVIGIDHGNGNMKTENTIYPCGYKMQEIEPNTMFASDIIEYKGNFYSLSPTRFPYQTDKTTDEKAFILTLFSLAKEIIARAASGKENYNVQRDFSGFIGKDVILAVGLPPAHFEKQAKPFKDYFLKKAEHGIDFKYNGKAFNFYLKDVLVFPQDYAAAVVFKGDVLGEFSICYCIDIGDGTTDMVGLVDGLPDKETMLSRECGMSKLRSAVIDDVMNDYGITLSDRNVEDFLVGKKIALPLDEADKIKARIDKTASDFAIELVNQLRSKVSDFRTSPVIFCGGGAIALKPYLEQTKAFSMTYYIDDINANAVGYQQIAKMQLGIE